MTKITFQVLCCMAIFFAVSSKLGAGSHSCVPKMYPHHIPAERVARNYRNEAWGYQVVVPDGVQGWDDSAGSHHGFQISFEDQPQTYILVNGEANSLEYESAMDAALDRLSGLRKDDEAQIESVHIHQTHLGALPAVELLATYSCSDSPKRYTTISVLAIGPKKSPVYEVTLYAPSSRYLPDRRLLDELLKSWKYTGY